MLKHQQESRKEETTDKNTMNLCYNMTEIQPVPGCIPHQPLPLPCYENSQIFPAVLFHWKITMEILL